jgi:hypothetical protein
MTTQYTILRQAAPGGPWTPLETKGTGSSANAAIRNTVTEDGAYVAIPSRSWKPLTVTFENKPTVRAQ